MARRRNVVVAERCALRLGQSVRTAAPQHVVPGVEPRQGIFAVGEISKPGIWMKQIGAPFPGLADPTQTALPNCNLPFIFVRQIRPGPRGKCAGLIAV